MATKRLHMHCFHCELNLLHIWGNHMGKLTVFSAFCWQNGTRNFQDFDCQVRTVQAPRRAVYRISAVLPSLCWWSCRGGSLFIADHDSFVFFWSLDQVYLKWFAIVFKNCLPGPYGCRLLGGAVFLQLRSPFLRLIFETVITSAIWLSPHSREGGAVNLEGRLYQQQNLFQKKDVVLLIQKAGVSWLYLWKHKIQLTH